MKVGEAVTVTTTQNSAIEDRFALTDQLTRVYDWVDERRWDEADALFTEDVVAITPGGEAVGLEAAVQMVAKHHEVYDRTLHTTTDVTVELDGDRAVLRYRVESAFALDGTEPPSVTLSGGRGRLEARRTASDWRFCRVEIDPVWAAAPLPQPAAD
ncbi:hypothetical protein GCM10027447_19020 [Glycomyces halotolerans]